MRTKQNLIRTQVLNLRGPGTPTLLFPKSGCAPELPTASSPSSVVQGPQHRRGGVPCSTSCGPVRESESESGSGVSHSFRPHGLFCPRNSPGRNTRVGSLSLLQRIFLTQGSNPGLPHCRETLYYLSHLSPPKLSGFNLSGFLNRSPLSICFPASRMWLTLQICCHGLTWSLCPSG